MDRSIMGYMVELKTTWERMLDGKERIITMSKFIPIKDIVGISEGLLESHAINVVWEMFCEDMMKKNMEDVGYLMGIVSASAIEVELIDKEIESMDKLIIGEWV